MSSNANIKYILEHKDIVESHIQKHKATWQPLAGDQTQQQPEDVPINVFIRVRPLLQHDHDAGSYSLVEVQDQRLIHVTHPTIRWAGGRIATKTYDADGIYPDTASSDDVYNGMNITREITQVLHEHGRELSILAYGQTGTGKTFTTTAIEERVASEAFDHAMPDYVVNITLSILEIRGSASYDLLSEPALQPVKISAASGKAQYQGLSVHDVASKEALLNLVQKGKSLRLTRSTSKNDTSSRSHSIVSIKICQRREGFPDLVSAINIVDLAGSERSSIIANNSPERVKESIDTNKSLAALKECIRARLSNRHSHIPWRSDKLTMALKGAFDEKKTSNKLLVIACISPSVLDIEDSLNTLKYVTPFQLSAAHAVDAIIRQRDFSSVDDPRKWSYEKSKAYIARNMPKISSLTDRLLPTPTSGIASLFPLTAPEFEQLCETPAPREAAAPDARTVAAARAWLPAYHKKLQDLAAKGLALDRARTEGKGPGSRVVARASAGVTQGRATKGSVIAALNGIDPTANETGFVLRLAADGKEWDKLERLEKANQVM
ncbi:P-loop containing nucleoside triphosphate hydrolase protein [Artomyces pyxidatus]|uniref:P-loop containing nucleoside triphosphate hydrolase protein n=1 Tax=Artomyces pyxidatus TaxID=48021 RepID=A0ACB8SXS2_9AGAM|nr:P-loop containing nucleoside triphosphate hydrolase protein [Artomyces pyxidatus]